MKKTLITSFILCIFFSTIAKAEQIEINFDEKNNNLTLKVIDASLDQVLLKLASQLNFKLSLEGDEVKRMVSLNMTGPSKKVIEHLVKPNSVIISQSKNEPYKVTNVFLLPVGEQSREAYLRETMHKPPHSDNEEENAKRLQQHERRIQRRLDGTRIKKKQAQGDTTDFNPPQ